MSPDHRGTFANTGVNETPMLANSYVGSCQMGPGVVGWFVSSYNVAGVAQGKSGVLTAIVMSRVSSGDRQKRERVSVWGDTKFCLEEFFWHRQIRHKASLKRDVV